MFIEALRGLQASVSNIDIVPVLNDFRYFCFETWVWGYDSDWFGVYIMVFINKIGHDVNKQDSLLSRR